MADPLQQENPVPKKFDILTLALLFKGPKHTTEDSPELEARHFAHLRYLKMLKDTGKTLASGPLSDTPDDSWRGVCLFNTSLEEARAIMAADPQVQYGHFSYQAMTWYTPKGSLKF